MKRLFLILLPLSGCSCPPPPLEPQAFFKAVIPAGRELACYPRKGAVPVCVPYTEADEGEWVEDFVEGE